MFCFDFANGRLLCGLNLKHISFLIEKTHFVFHNHHVSFFGIYVTNESKNARYFCWIYLICLNAFPSISVMSLAIMLSSERKAAARSPAVPCKNTPTTAAVSGE